VPVRGRGFAGSGLIDSRSVNGLPIEITPVEVRDLLKAGEPLRLIDVREPAEHAICHIEGATLIPMQTVPSRLNELDGTGARIVLFCHHGVRSLQVADWLRRQGVEDCQSMAGGIDLWSAQIDPAVARY
jgi:rhodanese-related sulfurtransferase